MQDGSLCPAASLLARLVGWWRVEREIDDRMAGELGRFVGEAVFTRTADGMRYHESGELILPGRTPLRAERRSVWIDGGAFVEVRFADGRPFHRFDPRKSGAEAVHHCAPDLYRVRYILDDTETWEAIWDVTGPRKDYAMRTRYRRA